jgi:serine protease Do
MHKRVFGGLVMLALVPGLFLGVQSAARAEEPAAKPYLGVLVEPTAQDAAQPGAMVHEVAPDSPAMHAGVKKGDVIVKVGDAAVKDPEMLVKAVQGHKVGDKLDLQLMRDGKEHKLAVTLTERPKAKTPARPQIIKETKGAFLGVWTQPLNDEMRKELGVTAEKGAVVMKVTPDSPAAKAGIAAHDVITAVNDQAVTSPEDLRTAIHKLSAGKEATLKLNRGKDSKEIKVKLAEMPGTFGMLRDFDEHWPAFKEFMNRHPQGADMQKRLEEMHKRFREFEEQLQKSEK